MKIYLSGSFKARQQIRERAFELQDHGHECVSNWLFEPALQVGDPETEAWQMRARGNEDIIDVSRADLFVMFAEWPSSTGGRFVELGVALALRIPVVIIGKRETVFSYHSTVKRYDTWAEFLEGTWV